MIPADGRPCILGSSKLSTEDDGKFRVESFSSSNLKSGFMMRSIWIEGSSVSEKVDLFSPLVLTPEKSITPGDQVLMVETDDLLLKKEGKI